MDGRTVLVAVLKQKQAGRPAVVSDLRRRGRVWVAVQQDYVVGRWSYLEVVGGEVVDGGGALRRQQRVWQAQETDRQTMEGGSVSSCQRGDIHGLGSWPRPYVPTDCSPSCCAWMTCRKMGVESDSTALMWFRNSTCRARGGEEEGWGQNRWSIEGGCGGWCVCLTSKKAK